MTSVTFLPKNASKLAGVPVSTIRSWHAKFGLPEDRGGGAWRRYDFRDLLVLVLLERMTAAGLHPRDSIKFIAANHARLMENPFYLVVSPAVGTAKPEFQGTARLSQQMIDSTRRVGPEPDTQIVIAVHKLVEGLRKRIEWGI